MENDVIYTKEDIEDILKAGDITIQTMPGQADEEFKQIFVDGRILPYLVSTYGRIVAVNYRGIEFNPREMILRVDNRGYWRTCLSYRGEYKTFDVHRLLAQTFIPNPENKPFVNHIDADKTHCFIWNLEWVTESENTRHAYSIGRMKVRRGEEIGDNKFTTPMVRRVCELLVEDKLSLKEIAVETGVSYDMVRNILNGNSWKHISCEYDFSQYGTFEQSKSIARATKACEMMEDGYTLEEISKETGLAYSMVHKISTGERWATLSKNYKISNYNKLNKVH